MPAVIITHPNFHQARQVHGAVFQADIVDIRRPDFTRAVHLSAMHRPISSVWPCGHP